MKNQRVEHGSQGLINKKIRPWRQVTHGYRSDLQDRQATAFRVRCLHASMRAGEQASSSLTHPVIGKTQPLPSYSLTSNRLTLLLLSNSRGTSATRIPGIDE